MGHKYDDIPVIYFNFDSGVWEPVNSESTYSCLAASYKNQLEAADRVKLRETGGIYDTETFNSDLIRFRAYEKEAPKKLPRMFKPLLFFAAALYIIWWFVQK